MEHRVAWIHGIGPYRAGYSEKWKRNFNRYLHFADSMFIEVVWSTIFDFAKARTPDSAKQRALKLRLYQELIGTLQARIKAHSPELVTTGPFDGKSGFPVSESIEASEGGWLPDWFLHPEKYVGDFVVYLADRVTRTAVKNALKAKLRPLAGKEYSISLIAHSWGSVVAYESLLDLEREMPGFRLTHLFTLGSPLWLVQQFLDDRSGRKPRNTANWVNIYAQGDFIAAPLRPMFKNERDIAVPNVNGWDAHYSYFVEANVGVQKKIVASTILRE